MKKETLELLLRGVEFDSEYVKESAIRLVKNWGLSIIGEVREAMEEYKGVQIWALMGIEDRLREEHGLQPRWEKLANSILDRFAGE